MKPRRAGTTALPIITLTTRDFLIERTGEVWPISELPAAIVTEPSSILVAQTFGYHLRALDKTFDGRPGWQFRLTPLYREALNVNGEERPRLTLQQTSVSFLGFKGRYHYPLDPIVFVRKDLMELDDSDRGPLESLLLWGQSVRAWCIEHNIKLRPSAGGLAAQLLRDRRFYPEPRRKVPKLINAKAREHLPGNYYRLYTKEGRYHTATYIDLGSAHHNCARSIRFPCANKLRGFGFYSRFEDKPWAWPNTPRFNKALQAHGLLLVKLWCPHVYPGMFPPPYMEEQGGRLAWIYTNELPLIRQLGGRIAYIVTAFISEDAETGLNKYAEFALRELDRHADYRVWLKPTLLSAYGMLAAKPRHLEFGFKTATGGEDGMYPVGGGMIPVRVRKTSREIEAPIVNVIHRGMIEAETRNSCLSLARSLYSQGCEVLSIYADSLFVRSPQLPLLPAPWRVKAQVTGLRFLSPTQFVSRELTRLPGIPRNLREKEERRSAVRRPLGGLSVRPAV